MNIEEIYEEFIDKIASIRVEQHTVRQETNNSIENYNKLLEHISTDEELENDSTSGYYNLFFHNLIKYTKNDRAALRKISLIQYRKNIERRKHKQYQWLFSEGYEAYEKYLIKAYACLGFNDKSSWPSSDVENLSLEELAYKPFSYFEKQSKNKRDRPNGILNFFRSKFQDFSKSEKDNFINVDFKFNIILSQKIRNVIVHNDGMIFNEELFKENVCLKSGVYNNGNVDEIYINNINSLIKIVDGVCEINLCENINVEYGSFGFFDDVLQSRIGVLISHAHLLKNSIVSYLSRF